ncbi:hypothetical protein BJ322DRAFT_1109039 [Thelephora terrestris]|uniref:Uncharacterized protein n=1 Tax=Thelephora terrestris TaxID=56493 RepID=A0A9P6L6C4_9AGAM|nr:hypothetical protein BJ322DRAFT_1109039 [Thelephora terrestris]
MNGFSAAATSSNSPVPPSNLPLQVSHPSFPTASPDFSSFTFKNIGRPPTLLSRFSDVAAAPDYRSPSPPCSDMDMASSEDPAMMAVDDHRAFNPAPRKSLLDILSGTTHQGRDSKIVTTQSQEPGVPESTITPPLSASSTKQVFPRPESRMSSFARQLPVAADDPRTDPGPPQTSVALEIIPTHNPQDSDMIDLYADPDPPSRSPVSLLSDLSETTREIDELKRITILNRVLIGEREELLRRHEEAARALSRAKSQLDHVLSLTDEATQMTSVFVEKEKSRLETKKAKAEAKIEHAKTIEFENLRKAKELERIRQQEEERNAQLELEQAERRRLEEQRKEEEALAAERQRLGEIQAQERAQAEERRRMEEEQQRLAAEDRRRRDEEQRKEEEERLHKRLAEEREAVARKQEEDRRTQLLERRRLVDEEKSPEKEQQRIFKEKRDTVLKDKYKNYNRPEAGNPPAGPSSGLEGTSTSNPPSNFVNVPKNPRVIAERSSAIAQVNGTRDTPKFVPASMEEGRLPPDLCQRVKGLDNGTDHAVKNETASPVITPVDVAQPVDSTPLAPILFPPVSSMSTGAPAPAPATLVAPSHLPARPPTIYSHPPVPRESHYYRSRSRSSPRSPRHGSPISRLPSRTSLSPEPVRGRVDHYSPPPDRDYYRNGSSRRDRDTPSASPPPRQHVRKRQFQDLWERADTPRKMDYSHPTSSHPAKRTRAASPLRSRSPPSPQNRPLTQPPIVVSARRPPQIIRRGRTGNQLPLEQRLTNRPDLFERIR